MYSRTLALDTVAKRFQEQTEPDTSQWETSEFQCRELGPATYMITYLLKQEERQTRRLSIWQQVNNAWQIVYHQGTIVSPSP